MRYLKIVMITLIFVFANTAMAGAENTVRGTIVKMDMENGTGTLKEEHTNRIIPFRFSNDLKVSRAELPKAGMVVEFTYVHEKDTVAVVD